MRGRRERKRLGAQQRRDVGLRILVHDVQQLDEIADDLARGDVDVRADAPEFNLDKGDHIGFAELLRVIEQLGVDFRQLFGQHQQFLVGQRREPDDRRQQILLRPLAPEAALRQPRAQRFVAVHAAARVLDALRRAAHNDAQMSGAPLQGVVVHRQQLFVVVLPRDRVGDFINVHQLVDENQQPAVTGLLQKQREQLDVVEPVVVGDDDVHAQFVFRLSLGRVLAAEPFDHLRLPVIVAGGIGAVVYRQQLGKVKAVHHLAERAYDLADLPFGQLCERGVVRGQTALVRRLALHAAQPAVKHERQRAALRPRFGRHVADKLLVGRQALSLRALQTPLGRQVGVDHNEALVHHIIAYRLQQKALAAAVFPHDEAEGRAALGDDVYVVQQRADLGLPPDGDVGKPHPRHHAALERVDDRGGDPFRNFHIGQTIPFNSSI